MSDDWQPGDLALCVREGPATASFGEPGRLYRVEGIIYPGGLFPDGGIMDPFTDGISLWLFGQPHSADACNPVRFRKIRPHEADEEDRETIRLLTGQPEPVGA